MRHRLVPSLLILTALAVAGCSSPPLAETPPREDRTSLLSGTRPNVLLILLDDLGWDDLGVHGNRVVETPHIDSPARESVPFVV